MPKLEGCPPCGSASAVARSEFINDALKNPSYTKRPHAMAGRTGCKDTECLWNSHTSPRLPTSGFFCPRNKPLAHLSHCYFEFCWWDFFHFLFSCLYTVKSIWNETKHTCTTLSGRGDVAPLQHNHQLGTQKKQLRVQCLHFSEQI